MRINKKVIFLKSFSLLFLLFMKRSRSNPSVSDGFAIAGVAVDEHSSVSDGSGVGVALHCLPFSSSVRIARFLDASDVFVLALLSQDLLFVFGSDVIWRELYQRRWLRVPAPSSQLSCMRLFALRAKLEHVRCAMGPCTVFARGAEACSFSFRDLDNLALLAEADPHAWTWMGNLANVVAGQEEIRRRLQRMPVPKNHTKEAAQKMIDSVVVHYARPVVENAMIEESIVFSMTVSPGSLFVFTYSDGSWLDDNLLHVFQNAVVAAQVNFLFHQNVCRQFEPMRRLMGISTFDMQLVIVIVLTVLGLHEHFDLSDLNLEYELAKCPECGGIHYDISSSEGEGEEEED